MSDKDKSEVQIGPVTYGLSFACPECGEKLWVFVPTNGSPSEVMRARDMRSEDDVTDDDNSDEPEAEDSRE